MIFDPIIVKKGGGLPDNVRTITLTADPPEGGTVSGGGIASDGMKITIEAKVNDGYIFDGWEEHGDIVLGDKITTLSISSDKTLKAKFGNPTYNVGVDWYTQGLNNSTLQYTGIAYGDGHWAACYTGNYTNNFWYSSDGVFWKSANTAAANGYFTGMAYGKGVFVSSLYSYASSSVSQDFGVTWKAKNLGTNGWYDVSFDGNQFIIIGNKKTQIKVSQDGLTWENGTPLPGAYNTYQIISKPGLSVVPVQGSSDFYYNDDPSSNPWIHGNFPISANWYRGTYGKGRFVLLTNDSDKSVISSDGINWELITLPVSGNWRALAFGGGKFVALPYNTSTCIYSEDGIHWEKSTLPVSGRWNVAAGSEDKVVFFPDDSGQSIAGNIAYSSRNGPVK